MLKHLKNLAKNGPDPDLDPELFKGPTPYPQHWIKVAM
jgi:hypothetical protein